MPKQVNHAEQLYISQKEKCVVCHTKITPKKPGVVDYELATGTLRGLIHASCAAAVYAIEHPAFLEKVKNYLGILRADFGPRHCKYCKKSG